MHGHPPDVKTLLDFHVPDIYLGYVSVCMYVGMHTHACTHTQATYSAIVLITYTNGLLFIETSLTRLI